MPKQYPRDLGERVVRLVIETRPDHETVWATIQRVSSRLGVSGETVRKWVRQAEVNAGLRPGVSESENAEIRRLKKEVTELWRANEILRTASAFFAGGASTDPHLDDPIRRRIS